MSRDKRQKPAEGADPGSQQTPDQQGEPEAGKTGPTARLGKEAKIGAAVILVLVAALAVVAILRFTGRHSAGPVAAAAAKGKAKAGNANPNHSSNLDRGASRPPTAQARPWRRPPPPTRRCLMALPPLVRLGKGQALGRAMPIR